MVRASPGRARTHKGVPMKLTLRHHIPAVFGAAVLLTGSTAATAYALVGSHDPVETGNSKTIDDNHAPTAGAETPDLGDDRGVDEATTPGSTEPQENSGRPSAEPTHLGGGDNGQDATPEPSESPDNDATDDHGHDDSSSNSGPGSSTQDGSQDSGDDHSGSGSGDDATPEPVRSEDHSGSGRAGATPAASPTSDDSSGDRSGDSNGGSGDGTGSDRSGRGGDDASGHH